jgi:Na+/H+-translocating membrane pyrophosphatase
MNAISDAIAEGAAAYMKRQYMVVAAIGAVIAVILFFVFGLITALGFMVGAVFLALLPELSECLLPLEAILEPRKLQKKV